MSQEEHAGEPETGRNGDHVDRKRPPLAVVGSHRIDEEIFGPVFDKMIIARIWAFVRPYRAKVAISASALLIFTGTQLLIPLIIHYVIDHSKRGVDNSALLAASGAFLLAILVNFATGYIQEAVVGKAAENVLFDIRRAMFGHLQVVSLSFMDKIEVGRLMSRLQGDVNSIQEFLETSLFCIGDIALIFGVVVVMLWLDFSLGLLTLSVLPILLIIRITWLPRARQAFMAARETSSAANGALAEAIHGVRAVQSMDRQQVNLVLYDDKAHANLRTHLSADRYAQVMVPTVDGLTGLAMAFVIVVGGSMVMNGRIEAGVLVADLFYIQRFFDPIRSLTMHYSIMQRCMASGRRLIDVLDIEIDVRDKPDAQALSAEMDGAIEFKNVTFSYYPDLPVLKDVSFKVNPGETAALVGPTGSGKSSATALVHRFYDVQQGQVLVGGHDVRDLTQASLGRQIAMVLQEPFLFTGTVFENIRYGRRQATRQQVIEAAKAVGAHDFIMSLANGYETQLGERGGNLSIGQRQLLSFARALVADAKILVLDEATANVDSDTEMQIQKALTRLLKGRTGLVIAHRLATIRGADRIIVLRHGQVVETGNHAELIAMGGFYSSLYNLNYASFDDIPKEKLDAAASARFRS
ncbi:MULTISPECIES: ABC transporter ATP-binding protein [Mesorhizobium]|uniref:ABC transporter ATP-binding protein n=1 Tax=Mesorhizobium neociceri TaxID=1307853 RepID=A0A838BCA5_9HYPH|nr:MULTISPECIES: ABC transporter ATP-binding protein [Mesorhizobium]MBA1143892.1 ABC transporter ATP-binding protein [Mesorhizobium neociceri]